MYDDSSACVPAAQLDHALLYAAEFGWRVLPCHSIVDGHCTCRHGAVCHKGPGKHPRTRHGLSDASDSKVVIRGWWDRWPDANVAVATGSGLVVIDIDPRNGGSQSFAKLESKLGPLPRTHTVSTGGGGEHIYLSVPKNVRIRSTSDELAAGIDVKAEGGYVIAPPSSHASGNEYVSTKFTLTSQPKVPTAWLDRLALLSQRGNKREAICATFKGAPLIGAKRPARQHNKAVCSVPALDGPDSLFTGEGKRVWTAARRCLVTESGTTNVQITALATGLRNIPGLRGLSAADLRPVIRWWWEQGSQYMSVGEWDATEKRWEYLWDEWSKPETGAAWRARDAVVASGLVQDAERFKKPALVILTGLCNEMQSQAGDREWYLSWRTAMDVLASLGHDIPIATVGHWLRRLVKNGVIVRTREHKKGSPLAQYFMAAEVAARAQRGQQELLSA